MLFYTLQKNKQTCVFTYVLLCPRYIVVTVLFSITCSYLFSRPTLPCIMFSAADSFNGNIRELVTKEKLLEAKLQICFCRRQYTF